MPSLAKRLLPICGFGLIVILLILFKLWLLSQVSIIGETYAGHDDRLFVNLAAALCQGHWLGEFNQYTLIKGPGFPIWLALLHQLQLPLLLSNACLACIAAGVFSWAVFRLTGSPLLALLCFAPLVLNVDINNRVVREGFYAPLTSLLFALLLLQLSALRQRQAISLTGSLCFGLLLSWFWLTREEGVWFIPALLICTLLFGYLLLRQQALFSRQSLLRLLPLGVPFVILGLVLTGISQFNAQHYHSANVVDMKDASYVQAYGALVRVNPEQRLRFIPVTKATRETIYAVSPAFREIQAFLEDPAAWKDGCQQYPGTCGELAGGWFMWALRDAVTKAGYYHNGATAAAYYQRLSTEINTACAQQRLNCAAPRSTLLPILSQDDITAIAQATLNGLAELLHPSIYQAGFLPHYLVNAHSHGDAAAVGHFANILADRIAPLATEDATTLPLTAYPLTFTLFQRLTSIYAWCYTPWLLACCGWFVYRLTCLLWQKHVDILWLMNLCLLLVILLRVGILAVIDATSFPAINPLYLSPAYPLTWMFMLLNTVNLFKPFPCATFNRDL